MIDFCTAYMWIKNARFTMGAHGTNEVTGAIIEQKICRHPVLLVDFTYSSSRPSYMRKMRYCLVKALRNDKDVLHVVNYVSLQPVQSCVLISLWIIKVPRTCMHFAMHTLCLVMQEHWEKYTSDTFEV